MCGEKERERERGSGRDGCLPSDDVAAAVCRL